MTAAASAVLLSAAFQAQALKREQRPTWMSAYVADWPSSPITVNNAEALKTICQNNLDSLQRNNFTTIYYHARTMCDAMYDSKYEPWSSYVSSTRGVAPAFDPMAYLVENAHKRGIEVYAWINPYRAKTKGTTALSPIHPYKKNPSLFVEYGGQLYFDPGYPESRKYICKIVRDIVSRYDVDAIHVDDYFYPYPVNGVDFPDNLSFAEYGRGFSNRGDWRRDNVNVLMKELHETIHACKPWVKFGVSPFGIYRNKRSNPNGSDTNGLQNYDDLYADVLLWVNNGWVDYNIPQIYWEIGHPAADYDKLIRWWARNSSARPLFIGQDVVRTVTKADLQNPNQNQMPAK